MNETSPLKIDIQIARVEDRSVVIDTYLKILYHLDQYDYDVKPTYENAEWMTDSLFLPAAARGEPILIAWEGKTPVGMIFWAVQHLPYDVRWKTSFDYGIYIDEDYRRQKIGTKMWERGVEILKEIGVQRLLSGVSVHNQPAIQGSASLGCVPYQQLTYFDLVQHP